MQDDNGKVLVGVDGVMLEKIGVEKKISVPSQTKCYPDCHIRITFGIQCCHQIAVFGEVFCKEAFAGRWRRERELRVSRVSTCPTGNDGKFDMA